MDLLEPRFRPLYESISVGNKPADAQGVFFEGLLMAEGLGMWNPPETHASVPEVLNAFHRTRPGVVGAVIVGP